jgi:hypothetical protein
MKQISPTETDKFVEKLLTKITSEYEPEQVPVILETYAKRNNCYLNVDEKVKRDGGKAHYGWTIYQTDILCEAERHAVWENDEGDLIDITPRDIDLQQIMFVSDNDFVYTGQLVDNIRVNITDNPIVDDFILVCVNLEELYTFGQRVNDEQMNIPAPAATLINEYENLKNGYFAYIYSGGRPNSKCLCGGQKNYKNCHGQTLKQSINADMTEVRKVLRK